MVNGLGSGIQIPLFPGAKRLTFTDATAVQYAAKAYDSEIKSFYDDRLTSLCWQIKAQARDQIVYKNDGHELKLSLLPNPAGKTVIDYVVTTTDGVLGTIRIADHVAACTTDQYYCNGACVPNGTSCPAPTDASSCTGGSVYCPSSSGGSGWCQYGSCPSSSTTTTTTTSCSGTYQQSGSTYPSCNYSTCPNGCNFGSDGCPNGCYSSSSNTNTWPTDQTSCTSQGKFWCTSSSSSGWCQSTACPTSSTTSPSGTYEDTQIKCTDRVDNDGDGLIDSADPGCSAFTGGTPQCSDGVDNDHDGSTDYPADTSCYSREDPDEYYPTSATSCSSGYYWCSSTGSCLSNSQSCGGSGTTTSSCSSTQYMCNGACVPMGTSCTSQAWPTDQASCTSQSKFWCTSTSGGTSTASSGWCQTTACSTNYSTVTCAAGQWQCNNACISTTASCNGYNYNGTLVTAPSGTTCAAGYTWCASSQSCVNAVQPCYQTQTQPTNQQQQQTPDQTRTNQQQTNNQQFNQNDRQFNQNSNQGGPNGQFGQGQFNQGPSEADMKRQEEQEKRMREQQFQQMKRGMSQFARGVTQMTRFAAQAKTRLAKQGVALPLELTNALAKAPELLAKLKAASTQEEFEDLMGDMQDIGMIMQEWGPKMGELQRLGGMLSQLNRDVRNMSTNFNRVKRAAARRP
ncbi:MAG: hypothetical protein AAB779_00760, partial [Patescibacteria group bacterium]